MWFLKKFKLCKPLEDEGSAGGAPAMDMESAITDIGADLFGGGEPLTDGADDPDLDDAMPDPVDAAAATATTPVPAEGADPTTPANPAPAKLEAPNTWRPEAKAEWDKLPPAAQSEILKREADIFQGIEGYRVEASIGKTFTNLVGPYQALYQQNNLDPVALTKDLLQFHAELTTGGPQQKLAKVQQIAQMYGVDLAQLVPADPDNLPYVDPQVKALQQQLAAVQSQLSGTSARQAEIDQREQARIRDGFRTEIEAFAADPAHTYFDECSAQIVQLLQSGTVKNLKEAYDQAVWLNPVTREKEVNRTAAEKASQAREAAMVKAKAAKAAAAANVRTSAKQASGTTLLGSIDETLTETYRKLSAG